MRNYLIKGIMTNLKMWIEMERKSLFRNIYMEYYEMLKKKLER